MNLELKGFDNRGKVFLEENHVKRVVLNNYKEKAGKIFDVYLDKLKESGIVYTQKTPEGNFIHQKHTISYPYEWTPSMLKDALLFYIGLMKKLNPLDMTLKDALPENILFDSSRPIFVDFLSLVFTSDLKNEDWLHSPKFLDQRFTVVEKMLIPHFIVPFLFSYRGQHAKARQMLTEMACNSTGVSPNWRELFIWERGLPFQKYLTSVKFILKLKGDLIKFGRTGTNFNDFMVLLEDSIRSLDPIPSASGYASYYEEKKEDAQIYDEAQLAEKQKSVFQAINSRKPNSVLDIGANTGWYSEMSAFLGAKVISVEMDVSCSDIIYRKVREAKKNILPVCSDFGSLTMEIFAKDQPDVPLYRSALERLKCDLVLVLGLAHHLTLGEGRTISEVFSTLSKLSNKSLVIEFVSLEDEKIVKFPEFFGNLKKFDASTYNLQSFIEEGLKHFSKVEKLASNPDTRFLLVFDK